MDSKAAISAIIEPQARTHVAHPRMRSGSFSARVIAFRRYIKRRIPKGENRAFNVGTAIAWKAVSSLWGWIDLLPIALTAIKSDLETPPNNRAAEQLQPGETQADGTVAPWLPVDHSNPHVKWTPVTSAHETRHLRLFVKKFRRRGGLPVYFDRLEEGTGTRNYRVCAPTETFFVHIHTNRTLTEIGARAIVCKWLADKAIFKNTFMPSLIAMPIRGRTNNSLETVHEIDGSLSGGFEGYGEFFPYLDITHFSGTESELVSYAQRLGKLQTAVAECPHIPIITLPPSYIATPDDVQRRLKRVERNVADREGLNQVTNEAVSLYLANKRALAAGLQEIKKPFDDLQNSCLMLHDLHPHNAAFHEGECVLIYDYQAVGYFNPHEVIAYAIHRYVRECIRRKRVMGYIDDTMIGDEVNRLVNLFIGNYGSHAELHGFRSDLMKKMITLSATRKLSSVLLKLFGLEPDRAERSPRQLFVESKKHFGFLSEARYF